jgi:hypothetical protein
MADSLYPTMLALRNKFPYPCDLMQGLSAFAVTSTDIIHKKHDSIWIQSMMRDSAWIIDVADRFNSDAHIPVIGIQVVTNDIIRLAWYLSVGPRLSVYMHLSACLFQHPTFHELSHDEKRLCIEVWLRVFRWFHAFDMHKQQNTDQTYFEYAMTRAFNSVTIIDRDQLEIFIDLMAADLTQS